MNMSRTQIVAQFARSGISGVAMRMLAMITMASGFATTTDAAAESVTRIIKEIAPQRTCVKKLAEIGIVNTASASATHARLTTSTDANARTVAMMWVPIGSAGRTRNVIVTGVLMGTSMVAWISIAAKWKVASSVVSTGYTGVRTTGIGIARKKKVGAGKSAGTTWRISSTRVGACSLARKSEPQIVSFAVRSDTQRWRVGSLRVLSLS